MGKLALTIEECIEAGLGGRTKVYEAIRDKRLKARKRGNRTIVLIEDAHEYLRSLPDYHEQPAA